MEFCRRIFVLCIVLACCDNGAVASRKSKYNELNEVPNKVPVKNEPAPYRHNSYNWYQVKAEARHEVGILSKEMITKILNAGGVLGLGFLFIKELNVAIGTNLLSPFLIAPLLFLTGALLFVPDITKLGELLESPPDNGPHHPY